MSLISFLLAFVGFCSIYVATVGSLVTIFDLDPDAETPEFLMATLWPVTLVLAPPIIMIVCAYLAPEYIKQFIVKRRANNALPRARVHK